MLVKHPVNIVLDGVTLKDEDYYTRDITLESETGNKKDQSFEFTFYKKAYEIIKAKFIDNPNGRFEIVQAQIFDTCCGGEKLILDGEIHGKDIEYVSDECWANAAITEDNSFIDCIKTFIVGDNLKATGHPVIPMNKDVSEFEEVVVKVLQILMIFITIALKPILVAILVILEIIETVVRIFDKTYNIPSLDDFDKIIKDIENAISGLDRIFYFPSPYVRDYIQNICDQCGQDNGKTYSFVSTILNDPSSTYYNLTYFNAPSEKGHKSYNDRLISGNQVIQTAEEFLDSLTGVFNADWFVEGNVLKLERNDFRQNTGAPIDLSVISTKYTFTDEELPAYAVIKWTDDAMDQAANEQRVGKYDGVFDWNTPANKTQRGKKEYLIRFARAKVGRFTGLIGGKNLGIILKMSNNTVPSPKLLLVGNDGKLIEQTALTAQVIYDNFFYIDNPKDQNYQAIEFEVEIEGFDCTQRDSIKTGIPIVLGRGSTFIKQKSTNYSKRKMVLSGKI